MKHRPRGTDPCGLHKKGMDKMNGNHKISCYTLILEITRRCNMACAHCMRGDAQNMDMGRDVIEQIFSQMTDISALTISGGEPSICPDRILFALECAKKYGVNVGYVYIVTNGKEVSDEFLRACREWHMYCMECQIRKESMVGFKKAKEIIDMACDWYETTGCTVSLSMDPYHEEIPAGNIIRLLSLPVLDTDKFIDFKKTGILNEGRAKINGIGDAECTKAHRAGHGDELYFDDIFDDGLYGVVDEMYVNAEGAILNYCDYSYTSQKDHILGRISDTWAKDILEKAAH